MHECLLILILVGIWDTGARLLVALHCPSFCHNENGAILAHIIGEPFELKGRERRQPDCRGCNRLQSGESVEQSHR